MTRGPGLIGALLVGVSAAKALAAARGLPLDAGRPPRTATCVASHARARARSSRRSSASWRAAATRSWPGSTSRPRYDVLGRTLDDAAGEAFDKGARLLGLGYPGGPELDRLAREGDATAFDVPAFAARATGSTSRFSGLKTALLYKVRDLGEAEAERAGPTSPPRTSAAIVDSLVARLEQALEREGAASGVGDRRRRGRQLRAARRASHGPARSAAWGSGSRDSRCARTTRR